MATNHDPNPSPEPIRPTVTLIPSQPIRQNLEEVVSSTEPPPDFYETCTLSPMSFPHEKCRKKNRYLRHALVRSSSVAKKLHQPGILRPQSATRTQHASQPHTRRGRGVIWTTQFRWRQRLAKRQREEARILRIEMDKRMAIDKK